MSDSSPISVRHLTKIFPGQPQGRRWPALDDLTIDVPRASIFGLLGPNGAGKTTLVKLLLGLARPSGGSGTLLGAPLGAVAARRKVGFLPEGQSFPEYMTARQFVAQGAALSGLGRREAREHAVPWIEKVGLSGVLDQPIRTFSKGMKQRLGLAAALAHEPELLFLDEPTDGVDPGGRREIRDLVVGLREKGITVFVNSHLLGEIDQMCDHTAILNLGRLVTEGPTSEVKTNALGGASARDRVRYLVSSVGDDMRPFLAQIPGLIDRVDPTGTSLEVMLPATDNAASELIDFLRAAEIRLRTVQPLEASLEDSFIALIQADNRQRLGGSPQ